MYKCCWNCENGLCGCFPDEKKTDLYRKVYRLCFAGYPVSHHAENPFKQRYCKQFIERTWFPVSNVELSKEEALMLSKMKQEEIVEYWEERNNKNGCY